MVWFISSAAGTSSHTSFRKSITGCSLKDKKSAINGKRSNRLETTGRDQSESTKRANRNTGPSRTSQLYSVRDEISPVTGHVSVDKLIVGSVSLKHTDTIKWSKLPKQEIC